MTDHFQAKSVLHEIKPFESTKIYLHNADDEVFQAYQNQMYALYARDTEETQRVDTGDKQQTQISCDNVFIS